MDINETYKKSLELHKKFKGKIKIATKFDIKTNQELALAYTPGVAEPCREIAKELALTNVFTNRGNTIAIVTDGTAVLGLGDIGPEAGLPVMEGKAMLFKKFGNVDAIPILLRTKNVDEIVNTIINISPTFAGINLEDISAPRCFEIEKKLIEKLNVPVFHDDQHGTAIVVLAGLINACKVLNKEIKKLDIVINGAGAAGFAIRHLLHEFGVFHIHMVDSKGCIIEERQDLLGHKKEIAKHLQKCSGLEDALINADVFIGVSSANVLSKNLIKKMNKEPIIFALANPVPEISYSEAIEAGAGIAATGRSDAPNQINNALVFPGLFRGVLDSRIKKITDEIKIVSATALANTIKNPTREKILPEVLDNTAHSAIADAIQKFK